MKELYKQELELIKSSLWNKDIPVIFNEKELIKELKDQSVLTLIKNINNEELNSYILDNIVNFNLHLKITEIIGKLFDVNDIDYVFFKGLSNSFYYHDPIDRQLGDIDVLVSHKDIEKANKVLNENGFILNHKTDVHTSYDYKNIDIELHEFFGAFETIEKAQYFDSLLEDGISKRKTININGINIKVLPDELIGLVEIEHIYFHIKTGIGLRHIIDFMMYLDLHKDDKFYDDFFRLTDKLELTHLVKLITRTCIDYLGLEDNYRFSNEISKDLTTKFIELALDNGDFSKKRDKLNIKAISLNRNDKSFIEKLKFIHNKGKERSKFIQDHKHMSFLGFFFGIKYGFSIINHNSLKDINKSLTDSKNYDSLIEELGIKKIKKRYYYYEGSFIEKDAG